MLNIHPAIVHIPVGILTLYSVLELIRFKKVLRLPYWFSVKAVVVIAGSLGTFAALISGSLIEDSFEGLRAVEVHSNFAWATTVVYLVIAFGYVIFLFPTSMEKLNGLRRAASFIVTPPLVWLLSLVGFVLLTITGALGGGIAHGTSADPMVAVVYKLLGL